VIKESIVAQARTWIGTKFHHQGRLKKNFQHSGGCDCIGLLIGVFQELNIDFNSRFNGFIDKTNYSRLVTDAILVSATEKFFVKKNLSDISCGDIALFSFSNKFSPQHVGIIGENKGSFTVIHAYLQVGFVVEHILDDYWKQHLYGLYEL
jgi:NlpC/P60 family putative phage cell wall peptidase